MRRLRWQAIEHLTSGQKLMAGLALAVGILFVSAHFAFDERDRLLPQGIAHIDLFAVETCREESGPEQKSILCLGSTRTELKHIALRTRHTDCWRMQGILR